MSNRHKLNIEDSQIDDYTTTKDEVLVKGDNNPLTKNSRFAFPNSNEHTSVGARNGWKEISIDTINLTPKSTRSKTNSPFNYQHHHPHIE
jgi:predicted  nucleic acid-binding Zn-ribbon protein